MSKKQRRQSGPRLDPPCKRRLNMDCIWSEPGPSTPTPPTTTAKPSVEPPQLLLGMIIGHQQFQLENTQGYFYHRAFGSKEPFPIYTRLRYLYSSFKGRTNNIFEFEDYSGRSVLVKGPVSKHEFDISNALCIKKLTLPINFITFESELPNLTNFPTGSKMETFYLEQPKMASDLFNKQTSDNPLSQTEVVEVIRQVLKQLADFHTNGYYHGDVSLENIVINPDIPKDSVRFIDFARSYQMLGERKFPQYGKEGYTDPFLTYCNDKNLLLPDWYQEKDPDIYAAGVVIFSLVFGVLPEPADMIELGVKNYILRCGLLPFSEGVVELIVSLIDTRQGKSIQSSLDIFEQSLKL